MSKIVLDHIQKSTLTPLEIDDIIIEKIEQATAENADIWTSPDYNRKEYMHSFFQYPAMMIPAVQRKLIEIITEAQPKIQKMLDPFSGSATTLVASMESGLDCYGQDINPLAVLISKIRTGPYQIDSLILKSNQLIERIREDKSRKIESKPFNRAKWFKNKISVELSKIVRAIRKEPRLSARRFFWVVLAETVRLVSNDRTSTFKLHIRKQEEIDKRNFSAINIFEFHLEESLNDFLLHKELLEDAGQLSNGGYKSDIVISLRDSGQSIYTPTDIHFFDILVTSPPYGDNKTTVTYGQHSYLPLQWIDFADIDPLANNSFLKTTSEIDSRSLGGKTKIINSDVLNSLFIKSPAFESIHNRIKNKSPRLVKKVESFIYDLDKTLDNVFNVMKPNSYQIWTIGNRRVAKEEIPNDEILIELIKNKGGKLITQVTREIINKRMARRNKDASLMNNEDILIFRKIG